MIEQRTRRRTEQWRPWGPLAPENASFNELVGKIMAYTTGTVRVRYPQVDVEYRHGGDR